MAGKKSPQQARLLATQGNWEGVSRLWLDAHQPPAESPIRLQARPLPGEHVVEMNYRTRAMGQREDGRFLWGFDLNEKAFQLVWLDTFHTGASMMVCTGDRKPTPREISVLGHYPDGAGGQWGWRTTLSQPKPGQLFIRAFNVPPGQKEQHAIELVLTRRR
jgi:hypothetical protein